MIYSSKLIEAAVKEIAKLPGIGRKSAVRVVLHLLKKDGEETEKLSDALVNLRKNIRYCKVCHNISDEEICSICTDVHRDESTICVVESFKDIIAIENTSQYSGLYHVLGGMISPLEGITPNELNITSLENRLKNNKVQEILMALSATMEGDTTVFYLTKKLAPFQVKITTLARGVPIGGELEYTDEITLGRSILERKMYK